MTGKELLALCEKQERGEVRVLMLERGKLEVWRATWSDKPNEQEPIDERELPW